jgi:inhibitor of cysteine peptidase
VDLDERADGTVVALRPGDELRIVLPENPSTGFRWRLVRDGGPVCRLTAERYRAPGDQRPGAPGRRCLELQVVASGRAEIALDSVRSWDPDRPARRFAVTVQAG